MSDHHHISIPLSDDVSNEVTVVDQIGQSRNSLAKTDFLDGSDTLFSLHNEKARKFDSGFIQNWREDAKGLILLSGLVSASVAGFLSQAYFSEHLSFPSQIMWFPSLMMSLVCAVGATLVQGLVRRYLLTQLQYSNSPHWSARIRACIMQEGFPEFVSRFLKFLNLLLHTSIYLFLCGLFLLTVSTGNPVTTAVVGMSFVLSLILYFFFARRWGIRLRFLFFAPLSLIRARDFDIKSSTGWPTLLHTTAQEIVKHVSTRTATLDDRAMSWLIDSLVHEQELESFLIGIPGFYKSTRVKDPPQVLRGANTDIIPNAIVALVDHSLSSNLVSDTARQRRVTVSLKAMQTDPYLLQRTFYHTLCSTESAIFRSFPFVLLADQYANNEDPNIRFLARCTIAIAINHLEDYHSDKRCAGIIQRRLNWSEALFSQHCEQRDSVKLRNLVQLALELYTAPPDPGPSCSSSPEVFRNLLHVTRQLNVEATAPELRHEFCDLWNCLLDAMQSRPEHPALSSTMKLILSSIHPIFVTLHQGTESQSSAPLASTGSLDLQDPSSCPRCLDLSHCPNAFANPNANIPVAHGSGDA